MRADPAAPGRSLSSREWRTIVAGVLVVGGALVGSRWIGPAWAARQLRSAEMARDEERLAGLEGLVMARDTLERTAATLERTVATRPRRVLRAATPALGGSALQQYLESAADGAGMVVDRIEVTPPAESASADGLYRLSVQLTVVGDVHGLSALLASLERGPRMVTIDRLSVRRNSALRGATDVLQVSLGLGAPLQLDGEVP